MRKSSYCLSMS